MTELLVSIGIIVLLASIALPAIVNAFRAGQNARAHGDLLTLGVALEAYKADFNSYPRLTGPFTGAHVLCQALLAPGPATGGVGSGADGADGPGFRVRQGVGGRVFGPYITADKFKVRGTGDEAILLDLDERPILYYPSFNTKANPQLNNGYVAQLTNYSDVSNSVKPLFSSNDNAPPPSPVMPIDERYLPANTFMYMIGDDNTNGKLDAGETRRADVPFILWTAGYDAKFGPATLAKQDRAKCDDVTNLPQ